MAVSGSVTITGSVSITGSVTITGAITVTSGNINIATAGGTNIIIDKLVQGAYTERRSTLSNNGTLTGYFSPTGTQRMGKFFPRGMRGFLDTISVYCKDDGAAGGTITVYISPHPSLGHLWSAVIALGSGAGAAWRAKSVAQMWNYDSLFIWVESSTADMDVAYDADTPYDFYISATSGASWTVMEYRLHIKLDMTGQTIGNIPVSGTINTIEVPNVSQGIAYLYEVIDGGNTSDIVNETGAGVVTGITLNLEQSTGTVLSTQMKFFFIIDGKSTDFTAAAIHFAVGKTVKTISPISLGVDDITGHKFQIGFSTPIKFLRSCHIYVENLAAGGNEMTLWGLATVELRG